MAFVLTKDKGQRMWGGGNNTFNGGRSGGGGGSGAGGGGGVSSAWVDENYVSKDYFNQLFAVKVAVRVVVTDPSTTPETVISDTGFVARQDLLYPNEVPENTQTTDDQTGYVTSTTYAIDSIQVMGGLWTNSYLSALGQNYSGGGGGGGSTTLQGLLDVNIPATMTQANDGQVLMYDYAQNKWINATIQQSGGTVTSITAGTGLSGGTITSSGTIAISSTYQTYIADGETAYGWGNHANAGYATQQWVQNKNYLTGITSSDVTSALGYTPLSNATTFWGRSVSNGVVNGSIEAGLSGGVITGFHGIELNSNGSLSDYGGFIDFHFDGSSSDYTSRIIEDASGRLYLSAPNGVRIGNAVLKWDSANNALYLQNTDGTAVNLYATGGVSALGMSAGTSAVDAMTFNYVTINNQMSLPSNIIASMSPTIKRQSGDTDCFYLFYDNAQSKISDQSYYYNQYDNVGLCGSDHNYDETWMIDPDGCARFQRLYLDSTRYLYVSNGTLYYYNGSSAKQVAFTN